ncbi:MAG: Xaa-Pro peptidase family protein [Verrucomicrobiae bacterium]|nr:Xaa-Pro peptidase family protein [Verrucomicrobiae bacterium]
MISPRQNLLLCAISEQDADLFYATGFLAPDEFLYFEKKGRKYMAVSCLEYDRARATARVHKVINQTAWVERLQRQSGKPVTAPQWISALLREHGIREASAPFSFPLGLADGLRKHGIKISVAKDGIFPGRAVKCRRETDAIRKSCMACAEIILLLIDRIRRARTGRGKRLMLDGKPLTSERLRSLTRVEAVQRGYDGAHCIVAGGVQGCDPHERGHGPLRAGELIILDIFLRDLATGYWGDMTRTVLKGRATGAQRRQFETVRQAQKLAISQVRAGVNGRQIHSNVEKLFAEKGYRTGMTKDGYEGFFHGTGHGLGLEIHEPPRLSKVDFRLQAGNVVTVEPGLYYRSVGGVRIEDVALVQKNGCQLLSNCPIQLEI